MDDTIPEHSGAVVGRTWPATGRLSSPFGWRIDPIEHAPAFHRGIDVAAPVGTPVVAPEAGWVQEVDDDPSYGRFVVLDHGSGLTTCYAHLEEVAVEPLTEVADGDQIGTVGISGRTTGPHLHFEVRVPDGFLDPEEWLIQPPADGIAAPASPSAPRTATSA